MSANKRRAVIVLDRGLSTPSAMVRAVQYRPYFEKSQSWQAEFSSRLSDELRKVVNRARRPRIPLMMPLIYRPLEAYARRWERRREDEIVKMAKEADLVYLIKIPHLALFQKLSALKGPKVVLEMNDGLWLPFFRKYGWEDLNAILTVADAVICENECIADYARHHNRSVHVVPDSPQLPLFEKFRNSVQRDPAKVVIGWIGSQETANALYHILEPLEELFARHSNLHLRVVGAAAENLPRFENVRCTHLAAYDQETMVREALGFDIGIFPLFHNQDALSRGTLKAMIFMSAEVATIAERVGENPKLIQDGTNGLLAATSNEWLEKLDWLVTHPAERKLIAGHGLETIRQKFDTPVVFDRLLGAFDEILQA